MATGMLLFAVAQGSFLLVHLAPGDFFAELGMNPQVSAETIARLREQYALDQSWYTQFSKWLAGIARGNLNFVCDGIFPVFALLLFSIHLSHSTP